MKNTKRPASDNLTPACIQLIHELLDIALVTPPHVADVFVEYAPHCATLSARSHVGGWHSDAANPRATDTFIHFRHNSPEVNERQLRGAVETLRHVIATAEIHQSEVIKTKAAELRDSAERLLAQAAEMEGEK